LIIPLHARFILFTILSFAIAFSISINGIVTVSNGEQTSQNKGKVFVMYAASLIKTFENSIGPSFEKKTGYTYTGEGRDLFKSLI
jgi:ABC-type molybdate transport system substrate-binding protein